MAYEGQIAGVGDQPPGRRLRGAAIRFMQRRSAAELAERRAAIVAAIREFAELRDRQRRRHRQPRADRGRGRGHRGRPPARASTPPPSSTTTAASRLTPAAGFALPIVRKPAPRVATALGGGYLASGSGDAGAAARRPGCRRASSSTPRRAPARCRRRCSAPPAADLQIGDRVYMRHAKAGELCERFDALHLVEGDEIVDVVPTYRGEGQAFL